MKDMNHVPCKSLEATNKETKKSCGRYGAKLAYVMTAHVRVPQVSRRVVQ